MSLRCNAYTTYLDVLLSQGVVLLRLQTVGSFLCSQFFYQICNRGVNNEFFLSNIQQWRVATTIQYNNIPRAATTTITLIHQLVDFLIDQETRETVSITRSRDRIYCSFTHYWHDGNLRKRSMRITTVKRLTLTAERKDEKEAQADVVREQRVQWYHLCHQHTHIQIQRRIWWEIKFKI